MLDCRPAIVTFILVMNNSDTLALLKAHLARRRKAKFLGLKLALAKAQSQEAAYGPDKAAALWDKYAEAHKSLHRLYCEGQAPSVE